MSKIRLVAMDLDGTLTQHRTPLADENRAVLDRLAEKYHLVMVGAGAALRIYRQMGEYPLDIIGNYGMETYLFDPEKGLVEDERVHVTIDEECAARAVEQLRDKYNLHTYAGKSIEFHASGCVTFPILGTEAKIEDKLVFDPDRSKRRPMYQDVIDLFPEFTVFIGGSSSFDMAPAPYKKSYALAQYCKKHGYDVSEVVYCGDDYTPGGGDYDLFTSDFRFIKVDDYRKFGEYVKELL